MSPVSWLFYQSGTTLLWRQTIFVWQIEHISQNALYFQGVRLEPKAENELLIQHGLINGLGWIIRKQMITLFVFTAHVRIEGTFYQMVSAGSMKKRGFYQLEGCLCESFNIYYILIMVIRYLKLDYRHANFLKM